MGYQLTTEQLQVRGSTYWDLPPGPALLFQVLFFWWWTIV